MDTNFENPTMQSKKRYIIDNISMLNHKQRLTVLRTICTEYDDIVQESNEGCYINLNNIDINMINVVYNLVKSMST